MNVFFEESGDFKVGVVLSQAGEAYQVEMPSGKRTKVKTRDVLLQFEKPEPQALLDAAKAIAADVDLDFLWEVAGQEEFGFAELGAEYFGHAPLPHEAAGLVLSLHGSPIYFYKKGRGRYKAAPEQSLKAALAGIEKKKQQAIIQAGYVDELKNGKLPQAMSAIVQQLLFKPDKNTIEYKALEAAADELQTTAPRLMLNVGGLASPKELHMSRFLFEHFPRGAGFAPVEIPQAPSDLPLAEVAAFSIDDVTTTEIDDAFSVVKLDDGTVRVGIHIAAPGLGIRPDDAIDKIARARMSTVYMPGDKITMLPDDVVNAFTLAEGNDCPALSLYAVLNPADWSVISTTTRAERVPVKNNLRHNDLDDLVNEETLASGAGDYPHKEELGLLWQWALHLEAGRMSDEWESFTNALTTNLTSFFREAHHFPLLLEHLVAIRKKDTRPLTIWCSAASTGEEPYSIAMTACEAFNTLTPPVQIVATDIDTNVLATAANGVYPMERLDKMAPERLRRFFLKGKGAHEGMARVRPELRNLVTFRQLNLLAEGWPLEGQFDAIFCRNVMIYFDKPTQRKILDRFVPLMKPHALLFAGHSENFLYVSDSLRLRGKTVYELDARA